MGLHDVCTCSDLGIDCTGTGSNLMVDPDFVSGVCPGDYQLSLASPVVDLDAPAPCLAPPDFTGEPSKDLEGKPRLLDADGDDLAHPDLGALETQDLTLVPGDVQNLRWEVSASLLLVWDQEPGSDGYYIYRGDLGLVGYDYWGACLDTVAAGTTTSYLDGQDPGTGQGYFYLVTGRSGADEGTLGYATGAERSNYGPCM